MVCVKLGNRYFVLEEHQDCFIAASNHLIQQVVNISCKRQKSIDNDTTVDREGN